MLVDFGLAGRHIRPGCATGPYGAPEVWGALDGPVETLTPKAADVYAFGCVAFELLTGADALRGGHGDGPDRAARRPRRLPAPAPRAGQAPPVAPLAEVLFSTLRRDPQNRPSVGARAQRAPERRTAALSPDVAPRPGVSSVPLEPLAGAPDPGGGDCVACGRCCHHGPSTVHLLDGDDGARGRAAPHPADRPRRTAARLALRPERGRPLRRARRLGARPLPVQHLRRATRRLPHRGARFPCCLEARKLGRLGSSVDFRRKPRFG